MMIEAAVELDDDAMALYLDGTEPDEATLKECLRRAVITGTFYPVLCGSAFKNKGVQPLLDAVVAYLPSPVDRGAIKGVDYKTGEETERKPGDNEPLSVLAFKIMDDPYGILTFARIYSGTLAKGQALLNSSRDKNERVGRMVLMHANNREEIAEAYAGDIVALVGMKDTRTGETLCDPLKPVILEKMDFPDPVIEQAVEPKTKADQEKMTTALVKLANEDPSFRVSTDQESGQTIIKGMGELHLEIKVDILKRTHKVEVNVGAPQVAYREKITRAVDIDYTHKKQTGGTGQFARVKIHVEPNEPGKGFEFESKVIGGAVPKEYIPGVNKGLESVLGAGVLAGFPVVDVKVALVDGAFHEVELVGSRVRNRVARSSARGAAEGRIGSPRAGHEGRGRHAGRIHRLGDRRSQLPPRPDPGPGHARQRGRRECDGAARQHVRLREQPAFVHAGPRQLHHAVRPLLGSSAQRGREDPGQVRLRPL